MLGLNFDEILLPVKGDHGDVFGSIYQVTYCENKEKYNWHSVYTGFIIIKVFHFIGSCLIFILFWSSLKRKHSP